MNPMAGELHVQKIEPKPHLSISQLNMLSRCGEQYRQRYILGRKIPPGIALIVGGVVDKSVTRNLSEKLEGRELLPAEAVEDFTAQTFTQEWDRSDVALSDKEMALGLKVAKGQGLDKSVRLAKLHAKEMAPAIQPTHLQRKVEVELVGYPYDLLGYIDIQEGFRSLRDTKTSGKTPASDIADKDDQLTIYAMMVQVLDGAIPGQLCLDYLVDLKTPVAKTFMTMREGEDFKPILRRVESAGVAIEKQVFIPARETDWWCNKKWCGYWETCEFVKHGKRPTK